MFTLLIRGCGRTDPPHGDPETLFYSIFNQIFSLPDTFRVYPGRDYNGSYWLRFAAKRNWLQNLKLSGRTITTIGEEKLFNPRLSGGKDQFIHIMKTLYTPPSKGDGTWLKFQFSKSKWLKCSTIRRSSRRWPRSLQRQVDLNKVL